MLLAVGEIRGIIICAVSVLGLLGVDLALYVFTPSPEDCDDENADEIKSEE